MEPCSNLILEWREMIPATLFQNSVPVSGRAKIWLDADVDLRKLDPLWANPYIVSIWLIKSTATAVR